MGTNNSTVYLWGSRKKIHMNCFEFFHDVILVNEKIIYIFFIFLHKKITGKVITSTTANIRRERPLVCCWLQSCQAVLLQSEQKLAINWRRKTEATVRATTDESQKLYQSPIYDFVMWKDTHVTQPISDIWCCHYVLRYPTSTFQDGGWCKTELYVLLHCSHS